MNKYLIILFLSITSHAYSQEIQIDSLDIFYNQVNKGNLSADEKEQLEYMEGYINDSLVIRKTFTDKNGENQLEIKVINPCKLSDNIEEMRVDGLINYIVVRLSNQHYSDTLIYYNPDVAMSLMHLIDKYIVLKTYSGNQAIFIPFDYCGNADDEMRIAYIVFYKHKKYFYHINLHGEDFDNYKINDNLAEKFKDMPSELKKGLIRLVKAQYETIIIHQ